MSRFEGEFAAVGDARLSATELLAVIRAQGTVPSHDLSAAIACYLSSGEGWDEALKVLRGAFAVDAAHACSSGVAGQGEHEINQRASEYLQRPGLKPVGSDNA